jgi:ParB family transcriptional regulator, chromosome partitioning protein
MISIIPPWMKESMALLASIEELGIQEPLWITPNGTIISGHERWKIAQKKKITKLPIRIVEDSTEQELLYLLISANEARRGTEKDYIKRAKKAKVLYEHWDIRQGRPSKSRHDVDINESQTNRHNIAEMMGVTDRTVQRLLKLLELIAELQDLVSAGIIGLKVGNDLATLPNDEQRIIYEKIKQNNIKELKTAEIQAIKNELEYIRERDPNRNQNQEQSDKRTYRLVT